MVDEIVTNAVVPARDEARRAHDAAHTLQAKEALYMRLALYFGSDVPHVISHPAFSAAQVTPESIDHMSRESRLVERN